MIAALTFAALIGGVPLQTKTAAPAETGVRVTGAVTSATTGAPLADVQIVLVSDSAASGTAEVRDVRTGTDGRFVIDHVAPGPATITVSTIGYIFVRRRIDVASDGLALTIPLAEGTGTYEESVTVSPAQAAAPAGDVRELSSGVLQDLRGVAADDPVRAVQALPGVAAADDFQAEFSVRGAAYRHLGLVIDSVATPLLFHTVRGTEDTGSIAMINTDVIGRASLGIGSHPATHGSWLGPTLAFDMREGSRDRLAVRTAVSGTNASTVLEGPLTRAKRGSWIVSVRKSYVDWLIQKIDPEITGTIGFLDAQAKLSYDLTPRQNVQMLVLAGQANYRDVTAVSANDIARAKSTSGLASLAWRYGTSGLLITERLTFVPNPFRNSGALFQERARGISDALIWRNDLTKPLGRWTLEAGTYAERQTAATTLRNFQTVSPTVTRVRAERVSDAARTTAAGWWNLGGRVRGVGVTTGARVSHDTLSGSTDAAPWILVERDLLKRARLTFAASRAVQYSALESAAAAAEPLTPERAWFLDAGVKGVLTRTVSWSAGAFRRVESDILRRVNENRLVGTTRVTESIFPTVASTLSGTSRGVDFAVERRAERGPTGWISYAWAHTDYTDRVSGEAFDGDFDQRHTLNAYVQQRLSYRLRVSAKFRYGSNFPIVGYFTGSNDALFLGAVRNAVRMPPYVRLDVSGSRTFTFARSRLTLFVEIMNVLNRDNYGPADGGIRNNLSATDFTEKLIPILPSAGLLLEF